MERSTVIVVAGGGPVGAPAGLPADTPVVAADGGVDEALAAGLRPDVVVGDLDSASSAGLAAAQRKGARVVRFPQDKDATDLELALDEAVALGAERIVVTGTPGGRLDHLVAGLLLLGSEHYAAVELDALLGPAAIHVVRGERELAGSPGELVSLVALNGPAEGVSTEGLAYPLRRETLRPGSSRGVSNVFTGESARVSVERGVVLVVRPGVPS